MTKTFSLLDPHDIHHEGKKSDILSRLKIAEDSDIFSWVKKI